VLEKTGDFLPFALILRYKGKGVNKKIRKTTQNNQLHEFLNVVVYRIFVVSCGSIIIAMIFISFPHFGHVNGSTP
jgi:hypothetical protein